MSLFDWVELGYAIKGEQVPIFTGSFNVTIGDAVMGFYGARHTHVFGPDVRLVCDPFDMPLGPLTTLLPFVSSLMAGATGNVVFTYGTNLGATYVGPVVTIRRGANIAKTSDNVALAKDQLLARTRAGAPAGQPPAVPLDADPVDYAISIAGAALSTLLCAAAAGLELALRFKYPEYGKPAPDKGVLAGYGQTPVLLRALIQTITSRLMGLLTTLEKCGTATSLGQQFLEDGKFLLTPPTLLASLCISVFKWIGSILEKDKRDLDEVKDEVEDALGGDSPEKT
jgi:hypothetical protein